MKGRSLAALLLGAAFAAGAFTVIALNRACRPGPDADYYVERAVYNQAVAKRDADLEVAMGLLAEKEIERQEAEAAEQAAAGRALELERKLAAGAQAQAARDAEISELKTNAQAAIDANPAVRALVEAFELGRREDHDRILTLERQVAELGLPIPAGQDPSGKPLYTYPAGTITGSLWRELTATRDERDIWRGAFNREEALRKSGDTLRLGLERRWERSRFWITTGKVLTYSGLAYGAIKGGQALAKAIF